MSQRVGRGEFREEEGGGRQAVEADVERRERGERGKRVEGFEEVVADDEGVKAGEGGEERERCEALAREGERGGVARGAERLEEQREPAVVLEREWRRAVGGKRADLLADSDGAAVEGGQGRARPREEGEQRAERDAVSAVVRGREERVAVHGDAVQLRAT
eukprot:3000267-Rhodomonas_salina.3